MWLDNYYAIKYKAIKHHEIKGQKWGVRRTPEELAHVKSKVEKTTNSDIIKTSVSGHGGTPKESTPNSIIDHISDDGKVDVRSYYDDSGRKHFDVHTTDHGNPKHHPYGEHGEHAEIYEWNDDSSLKNVERRDLSPEERKENDDIL